MDLKYISVHIITKSIYVAISVMGYIYVLSAMVEDISIKDYLKYLIRFIIIKRQVYKWGLG